MPTFNVATEAMRLMSHDALLVLTTDQIDELLKRGGRDVDIARIPHLHVGAVKTILGRGRTSALLELARNLALDSKALAKIDHYIVRCQLPWMLEAAARAQGTPVSGSRLTSLAGQLIAKVRPETAHSLAIALVWAMPAQDILASVPAWRRSLQHQLLQVVSSPDHPAPFTPTELLERLDPEVRDDLIRKVLRNAPVLADAMVAPLVALSGVHELKPLKSGHRLSDDNVRALIATGNATLFDWARRSVLHPNPFETNDPALVELFLDEQFVRENTDIARWTPGPTRTAYLQAVEKYGVQLPLEPRELFNHTVDGDRAWIVTALRSARQGQVSNSVWLSNERPGDETLEILNEAIGDGAPITREERMKWLRNRGVLGEAKASVVDSLGRWAYTPASNRPGAFGTRRGSGVNEQILHDLVDARLGQNAPAWESYLRLLPRWQGSLSELVAHVLAA